MLSSLSAFGDPLRDHGNYSFNEMDRGLEEDEQEEEEQAPDSDQDEHQQDFGQNNRSEYVRMDEELEEKISGQWEARPFCAEDWSTIQDEPTTDPDYCFFCECCQSNKEQQGFPNYQKFVHFFMENYEQVQRKAMSIMSRNAYNSELRPFGNAKKPMRCVVIMEHFEIHAPSEFILLIQTLRTLNHCIHDLKDKIQEYDPATNKTRLNKENLNQYMRLSDKLADVMKQIAKLRPSKT